MEKTEVDEGVFGALLSKTSDCILHDVIIAKLQTYGSDIDAIKLIHNFCQIENKELKLMMHIARGRIYFMVPHRDPYLVLYYSIYIYVDLFYFGKFRHCKLCR